MRALASSTGLTSRMPWNTLKNTTKKTSVTPSATFDQMPRPNHTAKIGAMMRRGIELRPLMKGSKIAAKVSLSASQRPRIKARPQPITKDSSVSSRVMPRWRKITPVETQSTSLSAMTTGEPRKKAAMRECSIAICHAINSTTMIANRLSQTIERCDMAQAALTVLPR